MTESISLEVWCCHTHELTLRKLQKSTNFASQVVLASSRTRKTSYQAIKVIHFASRVFDRGDFAYVRSISSWMIERERANQGWLTSIYSKLSQSNDLGAGLGERLERSRAIFFSCKFMQMIVCSIRMSAQDGWAEHQHCQLPVWAASDSKQFWQLSAGSKKLQA